jgi:hypothetical protein
MGELSVRHEFLLPDALLAKLDRYLMASIRTRSASRKPGASAPAGTAPLSGPQERDEGARKGPPPGYQARGVLPEADSLRIVVTPNAKRHDVSPGYLAFPLFGSYFLNVGVRSHAVNAPRVPLSNSRFRLHSCSFSSISER